jgi:capsular exopolysaccharide synthesis family protein
MLPNPELREVNIKDYIRIVSKHILIILSVVIIISTIVTIKVFIEKPAYRSTVSILIEKNQLKVTKFEDVYREGVDTQYYQTQYKILASRMVAEKVYEDLKLSKDPNFRDLKDPVAAVQDSIKVEPIRNSNVVLVHAEDRDALRAAAIVNSVAKVYIQQDIDNRNRAVKEATGWLESQLDGIKRKMQDSEEALNKYIKDNKIVAIPDIDKKSEGVLDNLKSEKSKLETELANAGKRYKSKHPKMISLNAKLEQIDARIKEETENFLKLNEKMVQYNFLKKDVDSNQQLYTSILTRAKEIGVTEKIEASSIRIIDAAKPSSAPFKPNKGKSIAISLIFSLFFGFSLVFFIEYLDSSMRTAEDVSSYLELPFLGYIPSISTKEAKDESGKTFVCYQKATNSITESFRALRTSILFSSPEDRPLHSILITSTVPAEGKSFIATNLASIFSQLNEKVILIDVDMRRPKLYKLFSIDQKPGLSEFLIGSASLETIIRPTAFNNVSIITSGAIPPNPSELLSSGKISSLLKGLHSKFERIIIDSPPVLNVADTPLLANNVDGVILVVKGASTRLEGIVGAKKRILEAKGKIVGVIINNIAPEKEDSYYYYYTQV